MSRPGRGSTGPLLAVLVEHLRPQRRMLGLALLLDAVSSLAFLAQPPLVTRLVDDVRRGVPVGSTAAVVSVLLLVGGVVSVGHQLLLGRAAETVVLGLRRDLITRAMRLPIAVHDGRRIGDLVSRVSNDTTVVRTALTQVLTSVVGGLLLLLGALVGMAWIDPVLLATTVLVLLVSTGAVLLLAGRVESAGAEAQRTVGRLSTGLDRCVRALRTVRAANAGEREEAALLDEARTAWRAGITMVRYVALIAPVSAVTIQLSLLVVLGVGGYRVAAGRLSIGDLVAFLLFSFMLVVPLSQSFGAAAAGAAGMGALRRVVEILQLPEERELPSRPVREPTTEDRDVAVRFRDVCFGYGVPGTDVEHVREALHDVSFEIAAGSRVAIVGPSGAGKSTILSLLERFYPPSAGTIEVNGFDVRDLPAAQIRTWIGYVEQSAPVLVGTLRDNLTLAAPGLTDAACEHLLRAVSLEHLVARDPAGLDAEVGEGGVTLSGGERQRLALARALAGRPSILLLDESTSSLDSRSEQLVSEAVRKAAGGCTVLVVAHRLATVVDSDEILVLDGGRVVARGRHHELAAHSALYRELAQHQLQL